MSDRWVVDADHPNGYLVPLTADEQAKLDADRVAWAAAKAATEAEAANSAIVRANLNTRMGKIRTARNALAAGNIFASLTVNEKAVIDGLLEDDLYLSRLTLNLYEGVG